MHSRIEPSGCGRRGDVGRGIVWGIVAFAILLMVGGASADIKNGNFSTDLSNWTYYGRTDCYWGETTGEWTWYNGTAQLHLTDTPLRGGGHIEQTFNLSSTMVNYTLSFNARSQYNAVSVGLKNLSGDITSNYHEQYELTPTVFSLNVNSDYLGTSVTFYLSTRCYDGDGWGSGHVYIWLDNVTEEEAPPPPPSTVTISCPIGWCYIGSNYTSKTLLQFDNLFSTDTIQGRYNRTSKKYEDHRTGYKTNENVTVEKKEGYYYYFTSATNITITPDTTPSITLKTGWSLTSNYGTTARTLAQLKSSIGATATSAKYYDKNLKAWVSSDSQSVPAMEAFFVYNTNDVVWSG